MHYLSHFSSQAYEMLVQRQCFLIQPDKLVIQCNVLVTYSIIAVHYQVRKYNPNGAVFGHIHAVGAMSDAFQPVSAAGNQVAFVYAFPTAETYAVWMQLMIDGEIITLPVQITVAP